MWINRIIGLFMFLSQSLSYTNVPKENNRNSPDLFRENLEKNVEVYESIKECDVSEINSCGDKCPLCLGEKVLICNYCRGTGFLTMGDILIGTGNSCVVCMGKGEKECKRCMGSGYIAKWRR